MHPFASNGFLEKSMEKISLVCSENGSDKEYHAQVNEIGDVMYSVTFQYGRRGQTLKSGVKCSGVTHSEATKTFNKLLAEKLAKGYHVEDGAAPAEFTKASVDRPMRAFLPQLCNPVEGDEFEKVMLSDSWGVQEKMDGERRSIQISMEGVVGLNRKGQVVDLPTGIRSDLVSLYQHLVPCVVDGEIIGDKFYAFDLIPYEADVFETPRKLSCLSRYEMLSDVNNITQNVSVVQMILNPVRKRMLFNRVQVANGEGVVLKKLSGLYQPGRPNSGGDWLKFKFTESASCLVVEVNQKRSVQLGLYDQRTVTNVGNVTIPANHEIPAVGDIVEVRYLYAYKGGCLFQPVYLGKRTDISEEACRTGQLKYKVAA